MILLRSTLTLQWFLNFCCFCDICIMHVILMHPFEQSGFMAVTVIDQSNKVKRIVVIENVFVYSHVNNYQMHQMLDV